MKKMRAVKSCGISYFKNGDIVEVLNIDEAIAHVSRFNNKTLEQHLSRLNKKEEVAGFVVKKDSDSIIHVYKDEVERLSFVDKVKEYINNIVVKVKHKNKK